jgi:hypothetical protein
VKDICAETGSAAAKRTHDVTKRRSISGIFAKRLPDIGRSSWYRFLEQGEL